MAAEAATNESAARQPAARELAKILGDCRDSAIHRMLLSFSSKLDRVDDMLLERANRSDIREENQLFVAARAALSKERAAILTGFESRLRAEVDARIAGDTEAKTDFSQVDASKLTLVDTAAMDESVITGNITRSVEGQCHDELLTLNRGMAHLLGRPDLETGGNPLAPAAVIGAFAGALRDQVTEDAIKFTILKELNQSSLGDLNAIYADVNRHLINLQVVPRVAVPSYLGPDGAQRARRGVAARSKAAKKATAGAEVDVMALFKKMFAGQEAPVHPAYTAHGFGLPAAPQPMLPGMPSGPPGGYGSAGGPGAASAPGAPHAPPGAGEPFPELHPHWSLGVESATFTAPRARQPGAGATGATGGAAPQSLFPMPATQDPFGPIDAAAGPRYVPHGPLATTPSGYVPGAPIMVTRELGESLARLQAGETGFDLGGGAYVRFSGVPQGAHNVLRDLQESPLGQRVNQLEAMTIELVAMLFDFIFETRDLPDGIKALLARLQIPVLKAAMLDGAFFAKKSHPSRIVVNALARAGLGWSPLMGHDDPLYRTIHRVVHRILDDFTDNLAVFEDAREVLEKFLAEEEKVAEANIQSSAEEINQRDRREMAPIIASAEIERRIEARAVPNFLAAFLRDRWAGTLSQLYLEGGEDSEAWGQAVATLEDLVWSVQPKRSAEERKSLVAMLPSLLKRLSAGPAQKPWHVEEREQFLSNLVESHAAAVKPSLAPDLPPTTMVAEAAKAEAELAKAAGDDEAAARAERLATAMAPAEPATRAAEPEAVDDQFLEIAQSLERGMWVEFEDADGQLAFAKLAWVSPLRGTYLFTNRQGQKAMSMSAEELAERFRSDRARMVEAEPMVDRAFTTVMAGLNQKLVA